MPEKARWEHAFWPVWMIEAMIVLRQWLLWNDNWTSDLYLCVCFFVQDDILINLVIEQMINDTDPGTIILCLCVFYYTSK